MRSSIRSFVAALVVSLLAGCATIQDVRDANRLVQADNQLEVLVRTTEKKGKRAAQLIALGDEALKQANDFGSTPGSRREAISYCRIAATAFWKSKSPAAVSKMFTATNKGKMHCKQMGENAPDRDRLFLTLIAPFAALESSMAQVAGDLDKVEGRIMLRDGHVPAGQLDNLKRSYSKLQIAKLAIEDIDALQGDPAVETHSEFKKYYENERDGIHESFEDERSNLAALVLRANERNGDDETALGFGGSEVNDLKF